MESQTKVLECYRQYKEQPLRCAAEVREFASCVQEARVVSQLCFFFWMDWFSQILKVFEKFQKFLEIPC